MKILFISFTLILFLETNAQLVRNTNTLEIPIAYDRDNRPTHKFYSDQKIYTINDFSEGLVIDIYDLVSNKNNTISIPDFITKGSQPTNLFVQKNIAYVSYYPKSIIVTVNLETKTYQVININLKEMSVDHGISAVSTCTFPNIKQESIILYTPHLSAWESGSSQGAPMFSKFKKKNESYIIQTSFAPYEGIMYAKDKQQKTFGYELSVPSTFSANNNFVISYPANQKIDIYNVDTGNLDKRVLANSKYISAPPVPYNTNKLDDRNFQIKYRSKNSFYGPIYYHSKKEVWSRIIYLKSIDKEGDYRIAIILLNENFEKIGEHTIEDKSIEGHPIFTPEGFLFAKSRRTETHENILAYRHYYEIFVE